MTGLTGVEFHVADVEASIAFYATLGFRVVTRWEDWVRLDRDGAELVLMGDGYLRSHDHYSRHIWIARLGAWASR